MLMLLSTDEDEMQKHLWNVTQGQRLASLSAARSASHQVILEGGTGTILSKSEGCGREQLAGQWVQRSILLNAVWPWMRKEKKYVK